MKRLYKPREYAIYFQWKYEPIPDDPNCNHIYDGSEDSIIVESALERDVEIKDMIRRNDFQYIAWCQIYSNGEYGPDHVIIDNR